MVRACCSSDDSSAAGCACGRDLEVSGVHAELRVTASLPSLWRVVVVDRQSTNGSKLNGSALAARQENELSPQDLLQFGKSVLRFSVSTSDATSSEDVKEESIATAADVTQQPEQPATSESAVVAPDVVTDENAFENNGDDAVRRPELKRQREAEEEPVTTAALRADGPSSECMVCGMSLAGFSILEQQFHVNACLDGGAGALLTRPSSAATSTAERRTSKKARRQLQQQQLTSSTDDAEMAMALTLSKSLVGPEQEVDMKMALLHGELAQVDAEMRKLSKRRAAILKKLERLEKAKRKVRQARVLSPELALQALDLELALAVLFPESQQQLREPATARKTRVSMVRWLRQTR
ncbi:hypothetical protein PINS_up023941 [Pythium insidiosum]|nr:hypothetical protein PINS_up023941 [Pythium insidiosum]